VRGLAGGEAAATQVAQLRQSGETQEDFFLMEEMVMSG